MVEHGRLCSQKIHREIPIDRTELFPKRSDLLRFRQQEARRAIAEILASTV